MLVRHDDALGVTGAAGGVLDQRDVVRGDGGKFERLAAELSHKMSDVRRAVGASSEEARLGFVREIDFGAIRVALKDAETVYDQMATAMALANQEAVACERETLHLKR